jgi:hypothetical protein
MTNTDQQWSITQVADPDGEPALVRLKVRIPCGALTVEGELILEPGEAYSLAGALQDAALRPDDALGSLPATRRDT